MASPTSASGARLRAAPVPHPASDAARLVALDAFRFLAACCVALYHFNLLLNLELGRWSPAIDRFYLMVDFFFVLSGFVIFLTYADRLGTAKRLQSYFAARLARIYPLHLLTLAFMLLVVAAAAVSGLRSDDPQQWSLSVLPAHLALVQAWGFYDRLYFNAPAWSISAEFFAYLLAPALLPLARRTNLAQGLGLTVGAILLFVALRRWLDLREPWTNATYDFGMLRALPEFFLGAVAAQAFRTRALRFRPGVWTIAVLLAGALAALHFGWRDEWAVAPLAALVPVVALCERDGRFTTLVGPAARRLGDASYALYMWHMAVLIPFAALARRKGLIGSPAAPFVAAALFLAILALSLATHAWFEAPIRAAMRRWFEQRFSRAPA